MDIFFKPPKLEGTAEQKLEALERWVKTLCTELNLIFDSMRRSK